MLLVSCVPLVSWVFCPKSLKKSQQWAQNVDKILRGERHMGHSFHAQLGSSVGVLDSGPLALIMLANIHCLASRILQLETLCLTGYNWPCGRAQFVIAISQSTADKLDDKIKSATGGGSWPAKWVSPAFGAPLAWQLSHLSLCLSWSDLSCLDCRWPKMAAVFMPVVYNYFIWPKLDDMGHTLHLVSCRHLRVS